ncbi:uncharacterized protein MrH_0503 [Meiothermus ruber H328]|nr:uncharacterized protein MrH_0503 [Meiothermus ruber H328]
MGQGNLTGFGDGAPANQARVGDGVVGAAEGRGSDQTAQEPSSSGMNTGDLERLLVLQGWEQPHHALGQHGLARAGGTGHEQVVGAGCGNFQGPLGLGLALHVQQVEGCFSRFRLRAGTGGGQVFLALQEAHHLGQVGRPKHLHPLDEGGLLGRGLGHQESVALLVGPQRQVHRAGHRAQLTVQAQLTRRRKALQGLERNDPLRTEQPQRDGQVVVGAFFAQLGRGQVDHHPPLGVGKPGVLEGRPHPLARLLHGLVGQAHHRIERHALRNIHLDRDGLGLEAEQTVGTYLRQHALQSTCSSTNFPLILGPPARVRTGKPGSQRQARGRG